MSACRRCNNAKASRTPEQAGMQLLAVPFTPTYAEYIFLKGRRVLADQMEYLVAHFPALEPAARAHATLADVTGGRGGTPAMRVSPRRSAWSITSTRATSSSGPTIRCRPTWWIATATRPTRCTASRASSATSSSGSGPRASASPSTRACAARPPFAARIYPAYKANRELPPADLKRQFALCREFCRHLGLAEFASAQYEADDIIGTLAARTRAAGFCERAGDARQGPVAAHPRRATCTGTTPATRAISYHEIGARFGAVPELIADFLALTGDSVDNIPGVPGIGKKTAAELFAVFGSLDELYANLERVAALKLRGAGGIAAKLLAHKDAAYLARRLTGIVCDIPLAGARR